MERTERSQEVELRRTSAVSRSSVAVMAWNEASVSRWDPERESSVSIMEVELVG